jgi:hypothetical protein
LNPSHDTGAPGTGENDPPEPPVLRCVLAGHAATRVPVEAIGPLRKQVGPPCGKPLPVNFLKHADEQTVAGLAAVFNAIHEHHLAPEGNPGVFRHWGVVGAPRFLGRAAMTSDLPRFLVEGAWEVSPHMIPHRSLHSLSGSVSQALKIHGPNFGVGGGPGCEAEVLLAGLAMLQDMRLPGVWVVLTRLDPELPDDGITGKPVPGTFCLGLALALVPAGTAQGASLELTIGSEPAATGQAPAMTMDALVGLLEQLPKQSSVTHPLGTTGRLTLRRAAPLPWGRPHLLLSPDRALTNR